MFQIECVKKIVGEENVYEKELLSKHTTFRIGGVASYYVCPGNADELAAVLSYVRQEKEPYVIVGNGSNLLVSDAGFCGVVISTHGNKRGNEKKTCKQLPDDMGHFPIDAFCIVEKEDLQGQEILRQISPKKMEDKTVILAGSGIMLSRLANEVAKKGLTGFEFAGGIPGTLGGAVTMNAGAYGGEIKDCMLGAMVLSEQGEKKFLSVEELELGYRTSIIQKEHQVVLWAIFAFEQGESEQIVKTMQELNRKRREKQPLEYGSAGSTFKRPEGMFAGKLIEDAGLKGYRVGDVMVSDKHCGFVVNVGQGTSEQAYAVIAHVQKTVQEKFGVQLELEVKQL